MGNVKLFINVASKIQTGHPSYLLAIFTHLSHSVISMGLVNLSMDFASQPRVVTLDGGTEVSLPFPSTISN